MNRDARPVAGRVVGYAREGGPEEPGERRPRPTRLLGRQVPGLDDEHARRVVAPLGRIASLDHHGRHVAQKRGEGRVGTLLSRRGESFEGRASARGEQRHERGVVLAQRRLVEQGPRRGFLSVVDAPDHAEIVQFRQPVRVLVPDLLVHPGTESLPRGLRLDELQPVAERDRRSRGGTRSGQRPLDVLLDASGNGIRFGIVGGIERHQAGESLEQLVPEPVVGLVERLPGLRPVACQAARPVRRSAARQVLVEEQACRRQRAADRVGHVADVDGSVARQARARLQHERDPVPYRQSVADGGDRAVDFLLEQIRYDRGRLVAEGVRHERLARRSRLDERGVGDGTDAGEALAIWKVVVHDEHDGKGAVVAQRRRGDLVARHDVSGLESVPDLVRRDGDRAAGQRRRRGGGLQASHERDDLVPIEVRHLQHRLRAARRQALDHRSRGERRESVRPFVHSWIPTMRVASESDRASPTSSSRSARRSPLRSRSIPSRPSRS